jgi:DNA-binding CsgD family transcriptional regulator
MRGGGVEGDPVSPTPKAERDALLARAAEARVRINGLAPREQAVLAGLAAGLSPAEIAHSVGISIRTLEIHRTNARRNIGARTTWEAVAIWAVSGLPTPDAAWTRPTVVPRGSGASGYVFRVVDGKAVLSTWLGCIHRTTRVAASLRARRSAGGRGEIEVERALEFPEKGDPRCWRWRGGRWKADCDTRPTPKDLARWDAR